MPETVCNVLLDEEAVDLRQDEVRDDREFSLDVLLRDVQIYSERHLVCHRGSVYFFSINQSMNLFSEHVNLTIYL